MPSLSPDEESSIRQELAPGETILWTGQPSPKAIFHAYDFFLVPFSLFWCGFTLFWELAASRSGGVFFLLWGVPFILVGQYILWGRFVYTAWKKKRVLYVLTDRRALTIVRPPQARVIAANLFVLQNVQKELRRDGIGTVTIGTASVIPMGFGNRRTQSTDGLSLNAGVPIFVDIENASDVFALIESRRALLHGAQTSVLPPPVLPAR